MKTTTSAFLKYVGGSGPTTTFECSICGEPFKYRESIHVRKVVGEEFKLHVEAEHPGVGFRKPDKGRIVMVQGPNTFTEYEVSSVNEQRQTADLRSVKDALDSVSVSSVPWANICYRD